MSQVILVIHLFLALAIIGLVLIQRSEGGGLGIGGGSGGIGGFSTPQGTASTLTRITGICAACFFITSLTLGVLASNSRPQSILDQLETPAAATTVPVAADATTSPAPPVEGGETTAPAAAPAAPVSE